MGRKCSRTVINTQSESDTCHVDPLLISKQSPDLIFVLRSKGQNNTQFHFIWKQHTFQCPWSPIPLCFNPTFIKESIHSLSFVKWPECLFHMLFQAWQELFCTTAPPPSRHEPWTNQKTKVYLHRHATAPPSHQAKHRLCGQHLVGFLGSSCSPSPSVSVCVCVCVSNIEGELSPVWEFDAAFTANRFLSESRHDSTKGSLNAWILTPHERDNFLLLIFGLSPIKRSNGDKHAMFSFLKQKRKWAIYVLSLVQIYPSWTVSSHKGSSVLKLGI